jgi:hypothetical protein
MSWVDVGDRPALSDALKGLREPGVLDRHRSFLRWCRGNANRLLTIRAARAASLSHRCLRRVRSFGAKSQMFGARSQDFPDGVQLEESPPHAVASRLSGL